MYSKTHPFSLQFYLQNEGTTPWLQNSPIPKENSPGLFYGVLLSPQPLATTDQIIPF
jgi:hypothetical protein